MTYVTILRAISLIGLSYLAGQSAILQAADKVRVSSLKAVDFGQLSGVGDRRVSQSICAFSSSATKGYSITASGTGEGGSFALNSTAAYLPYEVLWSDNSGQSSGTSLIPGTPRGGFQSTASQHFCMSGPSSSASLIIVIRSAAIESARAGSYSGTLQIVISPE